MGWIRSHLGFVVVLPGFLVVGLLLGTQVWLQGGLDRHQELVRVTERVQRQVSIIHLWLEEALAEDPTIHLDADVRNPLDQTIYEVSAARRQLGPSERAAMKLLEDLLLRLQSFRYAVDDRWQNRHLDGGTGGDRDQAFDRAYFEILNLCDRFAGEMDRSLTATRRRLHAVNFSTSALVLSLFVALAVVVVRLQRTLEREKLELEHRVVQRTRELEEANRLLKRARDAAESANEAKDAFLANMSHEVRTPLNAILGITSLLRDAHPDPVLQRRLQTVDRSGRALLEMLDQALSFSSVEAAGLVAPKFEVFSPSRILSELSDLFEPEADARGIRLETARSMPLEVFGDLQGFRQIAQNLLSNAVKFTDEGHVRLELCAGDKSLDLTVADSGPGVSSEDQTAIFEPFTQVDASTTRRHGGAGLGLAICKQIVDQLGGSIEVDSELGRGCAFHVRLPFETVNRLEREPVQGVRHEILVVDDHEVNRLVLEGMLERLGYEPVPAASGSEALALVDSLPSLGLVLMDCQMPGLDGYETTRLLRQRAGGSEVPIVALTARVDPGERERVLAAGMNDYLTKPITLEELRPCLERWAPSVAVTPRSECQGTSESIVECLDERVLGHLDRLNGDGPEFTVRLIQMFLEDAPQQLRRIEAAACQQSGVALQEEAHRMRSSAASLGAVRLVDASRALEESSDRDDRERLLQRVRAALDEARCALEARTRPEQGGAV